MLVRGLILIIEILIIFLCTYVILMKLSINKLKGYLNNTKSVRTSGWMDKISKEIREASNKELLNKRLRLATPLKILIISLSLFFVSYLSFLFMLKIKSTAFILAVYISALPIILVKILLSKEKNSILSKLPSYVVNLKNHIYADNNIINAIRITSVEPPLEKYITQYNLNISKGMLPNQAFEQLKSSVNIEKFSELIMACEVCYKNGGNFIYVLDKYLSILTKENIEREETKEKAYSSILTLIAMLLLNVFVIVGFVFNNDTYGEIVKTTPIGKLILNFNVLSYLVIGFFVSKIYKLEE